VIAVVDRDDAIVMIENIARYIEAGDPPLQAALKGAEQIGFTILSLTVSLIALLIPLLFMADVVGPPRPLRCRARAPLPWPLVRKHPTRRGGERLCDSGDRPSCCPRLRSSTDPSSLSRS
jgi:hypothetical protein